MTINFPNPIFILKEKKAEKQRIRTEKFEARRKRDDERRKAKDDERKKRKDAQKSEITKNLSRKYSSGGDRGDSDEVFDNSEQTTKMHKKPDKNSSKKDRYGNFNFYPRAAQKKSLLFTFYFAVLVVRIDVSQIKAFREFNPN
jgi:hypothetical protein